MLFPSCSTGFHLQVSLAFPNPFGPESLHGDLAQTYHRPLKSFSLCSPCTSFASAATHVHGKLWRVMLQLPSSFVLFREALLFYCSILPCLEGKPSFTAQSCLALKGNPSFGWSWLTPHYYCFNTCTFHNRTINLVVWLDSNKPSFSTASNESHIFVSFLAHPELQHFDSYLLPPPTQNSCSLHDAIPSLTNEKKHWDEKRYSNFWYSCHHWCCCKVLLAAIWICFHRSRCFGFFPPCMSMEGSLFSFWCDQGLWMGLHRAVIRHWESY